MRPSIFATRNYKQFIKDWLKSQPKGGRGLLSRIAEKTSISPAMMTHVLSGEKHFSLEAANDMASFMALNEEETDYFLLLVSFERAGTHALRERTKRKILAEQKKANDTREKFRRDQELPEMVKTLFYSHWIYAGVRNLTACPTFNTVDRIAEHLSLPREQIQKAVDFLVQHGLCVISKGKIEAGPRVTYLGNDTSLIYKHHHNWRVHGLSKMFGQTEQDFFFTAPMSLSREAAELIRHKLPILIEEIRAIVGSSSSEVVRCLNVDWFAY